MSDRTVSGVSLNSTQKVAVILKLLGEKPYEYSLTEIVRKTGISKGGVYKILSVLKDEGLVVKSPVTKRYHIGPVTYRLGKIYSNLKGIEEVSRETVERVAKLTRQSCYICIWDGDQAVMVYKVDRGGFKLYDDRIGKKATIYAGAAGKLLAAYQDRHIVNELLRRTELAKRTPNTITDRDELLREYERIRKRGWSVNDEEYSLGIFTMAVPIPDKDNQVWACIGLGGKKENFTDANIQEWLLLLKDAAAEISHKLSFRR